MRRPPSCILVSALLFAVAQTGRPELTFIADARPGSLIISREAGDFEALGPEPRLGVTELEEASEYTTFPNVRLGVGWASQALYCDLAANAGYLLNERFRSPLLGVDAALLVRLRRNAAAGPHVGFLRITDPEWTGDADLDLDPASAFLFGIQIVIGYDIQFVFAADYLSAEAMDVEAHNGWRTSDDSLDVSGLSLQFGIMGRF